MKNPHHYVSLAFLLFCQPSSWPHACVFNEAVEKVIYGVVDNGIYPIGVMLCTVYLFSLICHEQEITGCVCVMVLQRREL